MVVIKQFLNMEIPVASFGTLDTSPTELTTVPDQINVTPEAVDTGWQLVEVVAVVAMTLMVAAILAGNLLVVSSMMRFKRLQVPTNYLLLSLAVADMCVAVAAPFFLAMEVMRDPIPGPLTILLPNRILATASGVSILTLGAIAYDRYTSLACPLEYASIITTRRVGVFVGVSWVLAGLVAWLPLFIPGVDGSATDASMLKLVPATANLFFIAALFLPVCLTMFLCYARIYSVARRHARAIAAVERSVHRHTRTRYQSKDAKYAKTLVLIIGVFLLLWLPHLTCSVIDIFDQTLVPDWVRNFLIMMAVLNSGLNPWVYAYKNYEFRNAFSRLFKENALRWWMCWHEEDRRSSVLSDSSVYHASTSSSAGVKHLTHHHHTHSHHHHAHCNPMALAADFVRVPDNPTTATTASANVGVAASDHNFSTFPRVVPRVLYPYAIEGQNSSYNKGNQSLRGSLPGGQPSAERRGSYNTHSNLPTVRLVVHNLDGNSHTHTVERIPSGFWHASTDSLSNPVFLPSLDDGALHSSRPSVRNLLLVHSKKCGRDGMQGLIVEPDSGNPCQVLVPHCDMDRLFSSLHTTKFDPVSLPSETVDNINPLLHCDKRQHSLPPQTTLE